jgi:hypothetical protein
MVTAIKIAYQKAIYSYLEGYIMRMTEKIEQGILKWQQHNHTWYKLGSSHNHGSKKRTPRYA